MSVLEAAAADCSIKDQQRQNSDRRNRHCVRDEVGLQMSWSQLSAEIALNDRWSEVILVGKVDRGSSCKRAVDQRRQLEHNTLTNRPAASGVAAGQV